MQIRKHSCNGEVTERDMTQDELTKVLETHSAASDIGSVDELRAAKARALRAVLEKALEVELNNPDAPQEVKDYAEVKP